ncbi:hypothetical protein D1227_11345 [Henriciella mobilis]|uniref:hypothetical protein n=1 Tax=Henriciella mobilis TaxID=2305467 RepID=UPI000E66485E|nr:hypothetical protein [Henriciella mobilis]RIJ13881.1 hypothetical protein D1231_19020 [Henriciella mobilis]RIJ20909.1 hypothetical protein D1227_11345 [Henriciella mobilis]
MLHPSTKKLIDRLATMTAQKKIDWIEKDNGDVLYATEGYVVRLTPEPPRVLLSTESGKSLEDATSTVLNATMHGDGGTYGDLVARLARDACRDARGTEDAINTLLAGLSDAPADAVPADSDEAAGATAEASEEAVPVGPDAVEDPVDDTTALSPVGPDAVDAPDTGETEPESVEATDAEPAPAEAAETDETPAPDLALDASVPDAVIDETNDFSETSEDQAAPEEALASEAAESDEDESAADDSEDSEAYVGGAVARLADEVNARSVEPADESEEDTVTEQNAPLSPSFSITPDDAPAFEEAPDEMAPEAAAPVPDEVPAVDADETAQADAVTDSETPEPAASASPNYIWDDAPAADAPVAEAQPEMPADDGAEQPAVEPAATFATEPVEPAGAVAEADAATDAVPAPQPESNVRYVPFGAAGLEAVGADASSETADEGPQEDTVDASLAGASDMAMPEEADPAETVSEDRAPMADTSEPAETSPQTFEPAAPEPSTNVSMEPPETKSDASAEPMSVSSEQPASEPAPAQPSEPAGSFSLSSLGAGIGFGARANGFQPTPPSPAGTPRPDIESVGKAPVFIDATNDYPGDAEAAQASDIPDVSDLNTGEDAVEASVSEADLDAVAPAQPEASTGPAEPDRALSLVDNETETETSEEPDNTAEEARPVRPKTRFNPWT